ncbi:MAG TPA: amidohydrolase family protein [Vicinamibacterales bacterium]|jgi:imidazolonepropionase-like amidohydrolase
MIRLFALTALLCLVSPVSAGVAQAPAAQGLVITNARILDGRGGVIERGTVVVRDGKIVSVSAAAGASAGAQTIDAKGMTVMPGFIESHRHVIRGNPAQWMKEEAVPRMQEFLEAGFTTVLSAGDPLEQILELRRRTQSGDIKGPRIIASGRAPLAQAGGGGGGAPAIDPARSDRSRGPRSTAAAIPAEETRATVASLAKAGVDAIKTVIIVTPNGPEKETLSRIVKEAKQYKIPVITHAVTVQDTVAAVEAGVAVLVHTPHIGRLEESPDTVRMIAKAGIPMMSTLGVFTPFYGNDQMPLFRDRGPFPWETLSSGGQGPVNARLLVEAGITYGYGTDTSWLPKDSLAHELKPLALMFSPKDIVSIMTKNAAAAVLRSDQIGTLEPGKVADIVILNGDPLANISNLLNVSVVVKGGQVVVDKRSGQGTR